MTRIRHTTAAKQRASRPEVPPQIAAPDGEEVIAVLHASGWQIYVCQPGADGKMAWALKAPEAELRSRDDAGVVVGSHFAGPTWKHQDGSQITAKLVARADSPDGNSIPWLLLTVTDRSGDGLLSDVSTIQRINTTGGLPPTGWDCSAAAQGTQVKVPYTAYYVFYAPGER